MGRKLDCECGRCKRCINSRSTKRYRAAHPEAVSAYGKTPARRTMHRDLMRRFRAEFKEYRNLVMIHTVLLGPKAYNMSHFNRICQLSLR